MFAWEELGQGSCRERGSSTSPEGCDGRCGAKRGYRHREGCDGRCGAKGGHRHQEGCDGRCGAKGGYWHWEGCLRKGKVAAPSTFEGSRAKLCWERLKSDSAQGEDKDPVDLQGSSSPGCCNSVGLTKDENAPKVAPALELKGGQQQHPPRIRAKGTLGGLQQPLKLLRSKGGGPSSALG